MACVKFMLVLLLCFSVQATATAGFFCNPFAPDTLEEIEAGLAQSYTGFPHLGPDAVQKMLKQSHPLILLDVREPEEFAVSHLQGAIRVDPGASVSELRRAIGKLRPDTDVVLYCSVGQRSSKLADRVRKDLLADGAASVDNLRGGLFAWYNADKPVVNAQGPTLAIHPYDSCRAPLIKPRPQAAAR